MLHVLRTASSQNRQKMVRPQVTAPLSGSDELVRSAKRRDGPTAANTMMKEYRTQVEALADNQHHGGLTNGDQFARFTSLMGRLPHVSPPSQGTQPGDTLHVLGWRCWPFTCGVFYLAGCPSPPATHPIEIATFPRLSHAPEFTRDFRGLSRGHHIHSRERRVVPSRGAKSEAGSQEATFETGDMDLSLGSRTAVRRRSRGASAARPNQAAGPCRV